MESSLVVAPEERHALMDQYQVLIKEQVPYVYLYSQNILSAHTDRVTGIPEANKCVWLWKVAD